VRVLERANVAVVVPAHDEELWIAETVSRTVSADINALTQAKQAFPDAGIDVYLEDLASRLTAGVSLFDHVITTAKAAQTDAKVRKSVAPTTAPTVKAAPVVHEEEPVDHKAPANGAATRAEHLFRDSALGNNFYAGPGVGAGIDFFVADSISLGLRGTFDLYLTLNAPVLFSVGGGLNATTYF
jgi:hypothetical protein